MKREGTNLKESKEKYMGGFGGGKGKESMIQLHDNPAT